METHDLERVQQIGSTLPEWFTPAGLARMEQDMREHGGLVAEIGRDVAGFLSYHVSNEFAWIDWMAVHPDHQRTGIGSPLVASLGEALRDSGVDEIRVETLGDSVEYEPYERTRAFYLAMGFKVHSQVIQDDPEWPDKLTLFKRIKLECPPGVGHFD